MGLDGFSMSNLGLYNRMTSSQFASEADRIALQGSDVQIKDVDALSKKKGIERKDDYYDGGGYGSLYSEQEPTEEKDEVETIEQKEPINPERYEMRINSEADIVELYDKQEQIVVQRLTINDLLSMVKNFDDPSGVLMSKKV